MAPFAQSAVYFSVMLGLTLFCSHRYLSARYGQPRPAPHLFVRLAPYFALCALIDLLLTPYLPHLPHDGAASLLLPLCVLGVPAAQHSVLLVAGVRTQSRP